MHVCVWLQSQRGHHEIACGICSGFFERSATPTCTDAYALPNVHRACATLTRKAQSLSVVAKSSPKPVQKGLPSGADNGEEAAEIAELEAAKERLKAFQSSGEVPGTQVPRHAPYTHAHYLHLLARTHARRP